MFRMNTYTTDEKFQITKKTQVFCFSAPENSHLFLTGWDFLLIYCIVEGGRSSLNDLTGEVVMLWILNPLLYASSLIVTMEYRSTGPFMFS